VRSARTSAISRGSSRQFFSTDILISSLVSSTSAIAEVLETRELIKISVLKNCLDEPREIAEVLAERTHSQVVQVIGKKIVLYKESKDNKKIELPKK